MTSLPMRPLDQSLSPPEHSLAQYSGVSVIHAYASAALLLLYLCLAVIKSRGFLLEGRFWAEDGVVFFSNIYGLSLGEALLKTFGGQHDYLFLVPSLLVYLSTLVPLKYSPLVTTYGALCVQLLVPALLIRYRDALSLSPWRVVAVLLVLVGLPQSYESWATPTNLQWHFALMGGIILALPPAGTWRDRWTRRLILVFGGLSGLATNFLFPLFLYKAWRWREREYWVHCALLGATAVIQLILVLKADMGSAGTGRKLELLPEVFLFAVFSQHILGPTLGVPVTEAIAGVLRAALSGGIQPVIGLSLVLGYFLWTAYRSLLTCGQMSRHLLAITSLFLMLSFIMTSLGEKFGMISAWGGGRYFFVSNVLFFIAVTGHLKGNQLGRNMLVWYFWLALVTAVTSGVVNSPIIGPSWTQEFERAAANGLDRIAIWPSGWFLKIPPGTME